MSGKTSTTSSNVQVPASVLAQYNSVIGTANDTATTPFQTYSGTGTAVAPGYDSANAGSFVAPVNSEQEAGITNTNSAAQSYLPYYGAAAGTLGNTQANTTGINNAATGLAAAGAGAVDADPLTGQQIQSYMNPYLNDVLGSTEAIQNQENQQQQAGQLGNAITSGAFGSDRTGIAAANLEEQQNLANNSTIAGIASNAFTNAQGVAQQQQGVNLAAGQANRAALETAGTNLAGIGSTAYGEGANTASEYGALGTGAQTAGLTGANAQIGAGTVEQQTQQAEDTAAYNQFLQQQSYPFQVGSWLSSISTGLGTNEGSTTTTTQPGGFFSDKRLKHDIKKIGKTYDGQTIYSYKMGNDPRTRIGLIAQEVEKKHPEAVGLAAGFKMVDYGKATDPAANRGHFREGGVVPFRRVARAYGGGTDLDEVLQAQQQMYSGLGGGSSQRQMPTQSNGGGHLVVSNAPPAAPHNGASDVTQTMQMANQGNKLYKSFNTPAAPAAPTAPSSGLAGSGLQSSGASTFADPSALATPAPSASAGVAPATSGWVADAPVADTAASAAAPAAGDAAASAAAPAAADAAAGAGGTALAAGGADAATAAAAELAADYVGADALAAVALAKRGGRIKRDLGGGMPYSDTGASDDIPTVQMSDNALKAAPAAGKQPTGLQTLLYMGDPNNTSSLAGSMFSNEAMATGGVAARRGFDDGGDVSDDDAPSSDSGSTAASTDTGDSSTGLGAWFQKNKGYILPALSGLAAMGTAKTVHPGVALAAGLGAGTDSYLNTQASLAKTADANAQVQGRQLENQRLAMGNQAASKWLNPTPGQSSTAADAIPATTSASPATTATPPAATPQPSGMAAAQNLDTSYRNKYYVPPVTKEEATAMQQASGAALALKSDVPVQQVQRQIDQRVQAQTSANHNAAQNEADQLYQTITDPATDTATKQAALVRYNALFQWTGDEPVDHNGNLFNKRTGQPMVGTQAQTLNPAQRTDLLAKAWEQVSVPQSDGTSVMMPAWQAPATKAASPQAFADRLVAGSSSASGTTPATVPQANVRPDPATTASPAAAPTSRNAPTTTASTGDPYLDKALADPQWRIPVKPVVAGVTQNPKDLQNQTITQGAAAKLKADSDQAVPAAASALQYMTAAKAILQSKGAPVTGLYGPAANLVSRTFGGVNSSNYQEVAKYLGNAAAQNAKANFPNATQSEMGMQFNELSPNVSMNDDTINDLLSTNIRGAKYVMDTANRTKPYVDSGNDPQNFEKWNQKYYPREKLVNATRTATGPNGQKLYLVNGKWAP